MTRIMNILLICLLIIVAVWSIYTQKWLILISNLCIVSGVLIDSKTTKLLMKENTNIDKIKKIKKIPMYLYFIGAIALIIYGITTFMN